MTSILLERSWGGASLASPAWPRTRRLAKTTRASPSPSASSCALSTLPALQRRLPVPAPIHSLSHQMSDRCTPFSQFKVDGQLLCLPVTFI